MSTYDIFLFALDAVLPIVLLILTGYILRKINLLNDGFLSTANKLVFRVALPMLLFYNVYNIGSFSDIDWHTVVFASAIIFILFIFGLIISVLFIKDKKQKGVIWQSFFRSNFAIIGLPLSEAIGGSAGLAVASILSAFSIPLFNIMAVIALTVFVDSDDGKKTKISPTSILKKIVTNPLIISVFAGFIVLGIRSIIPVNSDGILIFSIKDSLPPVYSAMEMIARIASPLALIVLGGQFKFSAVKKMKRQIFIGTFARIVFAPFVGILFAILLSAGTSYFNFTPSHYASFIALFGSPVAVSSAVMASQMNNDDQLANQILVWTSIFSVFTIFISIVILKSFMLL